MLLEEARCISGRKGNKSPVLRSLGLNLSIWCYVQECFGQEWSRCVSTVNRLTVNSLKQEICTDLVWLWACWADMGCYNDRCQEYEGRLGFVRDMGDTRLISLAAQRTVI